MNDRIAFVHFAMGSVVVVVVAVGNNGFVLVIYVWFYLNKRTRRKW